MASNEICKTKTEDNCVYGSLYDERDGKTYKTVKIGNQEWMSENLSYAYNEGHDYSGSFYSRCYNGDSSNCDKYGRLYQWGMAIDSTKLLDSLGMRCGFKRIGCNLPEKWRGLCPKGSHLPSKKEWENLIAFVGEQSGLSLKSMDGWVSSSSVAGTVGNGNGMDYYGFSVLPSGTMQAFQYYNMNERALFWTASDDSEKNAHGIKFSYASDLAITSYITSKQDANSVRCIKD
ncbi:FISUMP domain-containing protein [Fibrobacter sp.]|uniref:FISUMP domain-containing protein n=1 Tax=Fibrobacter sp. TaxID=35828 RepID=UPI00388D5914